MTDEALKRIRPLIRDLEVLDLAIARAAVGFDDNEKAARLGILGYKPQALHLYDQTVNEVTALLRELKALERESNFDAAVRVVCAIRPVSEDEDQQH